MDIGCTQWNHVIPTWILRVKKNLVSEKYTFSFFFTYDLYARQTWFYHAVAFCNIIKRRTFLKDWVRASGSELFLKVLFRPTPLQLFQMCPWDEGIPRLGCISSQTPWQRARRHLVGQPPHGCLRHDRHLQLFPPGLQFGLQSTGRRQ